jgi:hypothetical protein
VEQKNYATVRKITGYFRYEGDEGVSALQAVYNAYDRLLNFYYPCMKLQSTERVGSKKIRHYDQARTPFQRTLERNDVPQDIKLRLIDTKTGTGLLEQKDIMDKAVAHLLNLAHSVPVLAHPRRG